MNCGQHNIHTIANDFSGGKILLLCEFNWEEKTLGNRVSLSKICFFQPKFATFAKIKHYFIVSEINLAFKICKFRIISNLMVKFNVVMVPKDYNEYLQSALEVHNDM